MVGVRWQTSRLVVKRKRVGNAHTRALALRRQGVRWQDVMCRDHWEQPEENMFVLNSPQAKWRERYRRGTSFSPACHLSIRSKDLVRRGPTGNMPSGYNHWP